MLPGLLAIVAVVAIFYYMQGGSGQADACCHCCGQTTECCNVKLGYADILALAQAAGFGSDSDMAAAIALAESGGDPTAYNPEAQAVGHHGRTDATDGKGSYGLWQIYLFMHPEFEGQDLRDPATNAAAAYSIYSKAGSSFGPWSTYQAGSYEQYLQG